MLRPGRISLLLILAGAASCGYSDVEDGVPLRPSAMADEGPNIIIVIADDLGHADVGSFGNSVVRTPAIDRLASEGLRFTNAFVPASMCAPSRAALYTGLYPHRTGLSRNHSRARPDVLSIPHYLTALGYRTVLVGKSHVKPFDAFPFERLDRNIEEIEKYLDEVRSTPFVMVVAQHHPHVPWLPNREFKPGEIPLPAKFIDTDETREAMARYYTSIAAGDAEFDEILALLEAKDLYDTSIVIFLSDHGPQFPFAKFSNYDAGLRVPLIVRWPGVTSAGGYDDALVSSVDILPTIIEIAGGKSPPDIDGISLVARLRGEGERTHEAVFGTHSTLGLNIPDVQPYGIRTVRTARYRYIRNLHPQNLPRSFISEPRPFKGSMRYLRQYRVWVAPGLPAYWQSWLDAANEDESAAAIVDAYLHRPAEELYDLVNDPGEQLNLSENPQYAAIRDAMRKKLACWMLQQSDAELHLVADASKLTCDSGNEP